MKPADDGVRKPRPRPERPSWRLKGVGKMEKNVRNCAAASLGVKVGDLLLSANGNPVYTVISMDRNFVTLAKWGEPGFFCQMHVVSLKSQLDFGALVLHHPADF